MSIKRLNLFVILAVFLSGCGSVPATDWCYTFSFAGGRPSGWTGFLTDSVGGYTVTSTFEATYTRSSFTPLYIQAFVTNSGAPTTYNYDAEGWGVSQSFQSVNIPSGESSAYFMAGSAGTTGFIYGDGSLSNVRITGVRFYGNGSNPFPSNECTPSATATPSATSAPSGTATPVSLTLDTNGLFSQTNGWISVFVPLFALFVVVPVAVAILMFIGRAIIQALRGGR